MGGSFKAGRRLVGWQFGGSAQILWVAVIRLGCDYLIGSFEAWVKLFRWQSEGWYDNIWVAVLRLA